MTSAGPCARRTSTLYEECTDDAGDPSPIQDFGGTSQSSPLTAGEAALVIQAYENTHHGASPSPALVKQIITGTASDLDHPAFEQGSGLINSLAAVQAAESWQDGNGAPAAVGASLVSTPTQLTAVGQPGAATVQRLTVRNVSNHPEIVHATTRTVGRVVSSVNGHGHAEHRDLAGVHRRVRDIPELRGGPLHGAAGR